jgi:hypothetical protein
MLALLWRLIAWLLGRPGSVSNIRIEDMATTRTITWALPAVGSRQRPLSKTRVEYRVKSAAELPWTVQDEVAADGEQKLVIQDPAPGTFEYRFTVIDIDGKAGSAVVAEKSADFDPPGSVGNVQIVDA